LSPTSPQNRKKGGKVPALPRDQRGERRGGKEGTVSHTDGRLYVAFVPSGKERPSLSALKKKGVTERPARAKGKSPAHLDIEIMRGQGRKKGEKELVAGENPWLDHTQHAPTEKRKRRRVAANHSRGKGNLKGGGEGFDDERLIIPSSHPALERGVDP